MFQNASHLGFESRWKIGLDEIRPHLLVSPKESELIKLLKELSRAFVDRNKLLKTYGVREDYVSAYSQVFLPTNAPKLEFLLGQLPKSITDEFSSGQWHFIDFGCGPGTYSLSWLKLFPNSKCLLIDNADAMLRQARKLVSGLFGGEKLINSEIDLSEEKRVLFFGNVINEFSEKLVYDLVKKFQPTYLIIIEPGTKASFSQLTKLRDYLLKNDFKIKYPCLSQSGCPFAPVGAMIETDWCHQVLRTTHDLSVERLCQLAKLDRKILPMIAHVYAAEKNQKIVENTEVLEARVVQFLQENKFAFEYRVCCLIEGEHKVLFCSLAKKNLSKVQKRVLKKASVGVKLVLKVLKRKDNKIHCFLV